MKQIDLHVEGQQPHRLSLPDNVGTVNVPKLSADGFSTVVHKHHGRFSGDGVEIWEAALPPDHRTNLQ